jgi:hypothetical protein
MKSKKGSSFERQISTQLSLWASEGKSDDWYWRTAGSGGRAKARSRSGKSTINSCGDIRPECGEAEFLFKKCIFELKRGYKNWSFLDCLDKAKTRKNEILQNFEKFYEQASGDALNAGVPFCVIIAKRDKRQPIIILPYRFFILLGGKNKPPMKKIVYDSSKSECTIRCKVVAILLEDFFNNFTPNDFKGVW